MATRIQLRRDIDDDWFRDNPTLYAGEIAISLDLNTFKIGDGSTPWRELDYALSGTLEEYIALSTKGVANGVASLDGAGLIPLAQLPGAAALDAEVATAVANHNNVTTNVHGIANTSLLATTANVATAKSEAISAAATDATTKANAAQSAAEATAAADATTKANAAQAAAIAAAATDATAKANAAQSAAILAAATAADTNVLTAVESLTKSSVGLGNVDNTADAAKPVSTAQATAIATAKSEAIADATAQVNAVIASAPAALNTLDELAAALGDDANFAATLTSTLTSKAPIASPTFTGTVTLPENTVSQLMMQVNSVGENEIIPLSINSINLASNSVTSDKIAASSVTSAKIANFTIVDMDISSSAGISQNKIANLTSDLDSKAPLASPTFTGSVSGITKNMVGLQFVDNVPDLSKPVSNATRIELDAKAPIESPTFSGTVSGITASMVGLGNVNNTSDSSKPISTATQTALDAKINKIIETNPQTGSYPIVPSDAFKLIEMSGGGTLTIVDSPSFLTGTTIEVLQTTDSQVTIAGSGFTPNSTPGLKLRARWSSATLLKRGTNSWVVMGDLSA